jgi:hypothetical protein
MVSIAALISFLNEWSNDITYCTLCRDDFTWILSVFSSGKKVSLDVLSEFLDMILSGKNVLLFLHLLFLVDMYPEAGVINLDPIDFETPIFLLEN